MRQNLPEFFNITSADLDRLKAHHESYAQVFRRLADAAAIPPFSDDDISRWARHPLGMGLARLASQGDLSPEELKIGMARLQAVPTDLLQNVYDGEISVDTDGASFSIDVDRGVSLTLISVDRNVAQAEFDSHLAIACAVLGDRWRAFLAPVTTLCLVEASGYAAIPHYSGSSNMLFGAMQAGRLAAPWITAEVLTHEAAHMWLSLIEDDEEFADDGWTQKAYLSPWRDDARPISGIVHGVYVFSMVAAALARWVERGGPATNEVLERLALVCAQVRSAADTVRNHPRVIPFVRQMTSEAIDRVVSCELAVPFEIAERARLRLHDHAARWREVHPHLISR